jgi:hypothetical protein
MGGLDWIRVVNVIVYPSGGIHGHGSLQRPTRSRPCGQVAMTKPVPPSIRLTLAARLASSRSGGASRSLLERSHLDTQGPRPPDPCHLPFEL